MDTIDILGHLMNSYKIAEFLANSFLLLIAIDDLRGSGYYNSPWIILVILFFFWKIITQNILELDCLLYILSAIPAYYLQRYFMQSNLRRSRMQRCAIAKIRKMIANLIMIFMTLLIFKDLLMFLFACLTIILIPNLLNERVLVGCIGLLGSNPLLLLAVYMKKPLTGRIM